MTIKQMPAAENCSSQREDVVGYMIIELVDL